MFPGHPTADSVGSSPYEGLIFDGKIPRESSGGGYNHQVLGVSAIPCSLWPIFESQSQVGPSQQLSIHIDTKLPTREDEQAVSMVMLAPWPGGLLDLYCFVVLAVPILKNDGVRQWVSDDIPYMKWKIIHSCSNPPSSTHSCDSHGGTLRDHMLGDHSHAIDAIRAMIIPCHDMGITSENQWQI